MIVKSKNIMKKNLKLFILLFVFIFIALFGLFNLESTKKTDLAKDKIPALNIQNIESLKLENTKAYIIELGSLNCLPCKMMQSVLKQVEQKYEKQVKIIFYDVWTEKDADMAEKYQVNIIPTQVFLDKNKKEFFRNEGFLPFEKITKILAEHGINQ